MDTEAQAHPTHSHPPDPREYQVLISRVLVAERHSNFSASEITRLELENKRLNSILEAFATDAFRLKLENDRLSTKIDEATYIQWHSTVGDEGESLGVDGTTRADGDDYQAHVGSKIVVLGTARVRRNG